MMKPDVNTADNDRAIAVSVLLDMVSATLFKAPSKPITARQVSWDALLELAACQGVYAFTADYICALPPEQQPPAQQRIKLALSLENIQRRYGYQKSVLASLSELFRSEGIDLVLLKGLGFSLMYPTPSLRESGDLDIFLCGSYKKGNELLEAAGFTVTNKESKHSSCKYKDVIAENHRGFTENSVFWSVKRLDSYMVKLADRDKVFCEQLGVYLPPATFNVFHILRHAQNHIMSEGIVLRHLCDWAVFIKQNPAFLTDQLLLNRLRKYDLFNLFEALNHLSDSKLNAGICYPTSSRNRQFAHFLWEEIIHQGRKVHDQLNPHRNIITKVKSKFRTFMLMVGRKKMLDYLGSRVFIKSIVDRCCVNLGLLKYGDDR